MCDHPGSKVMGVNNLLLIAKHKSECRSSQRSLKTKMKYLLVVAFLLATFATASVSAKNTSYIFETRVLTGKDIERVKISFEVEVVGPNGLRYRTDLNGKPFGWYTGYKFYYLKKTQLDLYAATQYIVRYNTFEDEVPDPEVSIADVAIVEPDKREPKNVRFCSGDGKNSDKTKLEPNVPLTLTKCK